MRPKGSGQKLHYLKLTLQFSLLVFSVILIAVGLWGPQFAPKNLTTLFVWVHYRGFLVLGLLVWGNIFCMSCPFIFVRNCIRIFIAPKYLWPKKLQNKWIGLLLFCSVLFFYEYLSLWSSPFKTALLIIAFFAGALLTKATVCKYLCPIGQFNFLASTLSPKEVKAKSLSVCQSCSTQDCLRGNKELQLRGCELHLLMPKKKGNLDCTFCMDCVAACPYENIHVASRIPSAELWQDTHRSGVGLLTQRKDIQAYIIAFTFGGLLNAFAMTSSAQLLKEKMKIMLNFQNEFLFLLFLFFIFLIVLPIFLLIIPEKISQKNSPKN
jgi:polyferredoxin